MNEEIHGLGAEAGVFVLKQDVGERFADFGIAGEGTETIEGLEADAGIGVGFEGGHEGAADVDGVGLAAEHIHGFDAEAGIGGVLRGGEQEGADAIIAGDSGDGALASFFDDEADLAIAMGLEGANADGDSGGFRRLESGWGGRGPAAADEAGNEKGEGAGGLPHGGLPIEKATPPGGCRGLGLGLDLGEQGGAAFLKEIGGKIGLSEVHAGLDFDLALEAGGAGGASGEVLFDGFFLFEVQFAVEVEPEEILNVCAGHGRDHTRSPRATRIF